MEHYRSLNSYLKNKYGCKVYKLALDGGFTCPNRDGTLDSRGCIFCSNMASGDFAVSTDIGIDNAIEKAKHVVSNKNHSNKYIAYFQNHTNTYGKLDKMRNLFFTAINNENIIGISIGTRPDCINQEITDMLYELNKIKPVWIELGLQTIHKKSSDYIRRCYELDVYDKAVHLLKRSGIYVITHMIIGLPNETENMIFETAEYIGKSGVDGIKFQLLHVLENTDLATDYRAGLFETLSLEKYLELLAGCIKRIPPDMTVHRLTGDGNKRELIAPLWSANKKFVLNSINTYFNSINLVQGELFNE